MKKKTTFQRKLNGQNNRSPRDWDTNSLPPARQSSDLALKAGGLLESCFSYFFTKFDPTHRQLSSHHTATQKIDFGTDLRIRQVVSEGHIDRAKLDQTTLTEVRREKNELGREVTRFKHSLQARVAVTGNFEEMLEQIDELQFDEELEKDLAQDFEHMYQQQRKKS